MRSQNYQKIGLKIPQCIKALFHESDGSIAGPGSTDLDIVETGYAISEQY